VFEDVARQESGTPGSALDDELGQLALGGDLTVAAHGRVFNQPFEHRNEIASTQTMRHRPSDIALESLDVYRPCHRCLS
jgi:hypothetical protein